MDALTPFSKAMWLELNESSDYLSGCFHFRLSGSLSSSLLRLDSSREKRREISGSDSFNLNIKVKSHKKEKISVNVLEVVQGKF